MGLKKSTKRLNDYYGRLAEGKAKKIKAGDVAKVASKLTARREQIIEELKSTDNEARKESLARKLLIAEEQLKRAQWLAAELDSPEPKA